MNRTIQRVLILLKVVLGEIEGVAVLQSSVQPKLFCLY